MNVGKILTEIDDVIKRLSNDQLLDIYRLFSKSPVEINSSSTLAFLKDEAVSTAYKVIAFKVIKELRVLNTAKSLIESLPAKKALIHLRQGIMDRLFSYHFQFQSSGESISTAAVSTPRSSSSSLEDAIIRVYQQTARRTPVKEEIDIWLNNFDNGVFFHEFYLGMIGSEEARAAASSAQLLDHKSDGEFIQSVYMLMQDRGCKAWELYHWEVELASGRMQRQDVLNAMFSGTIKYFENTANHAPDDGLSCRIMGTSRLVTSQDWKEKANRLKSNNSTLPDKRYRNCFVIKSEPMVLVTAIASLYKGGDFIEQFMDNITSQNCFDDYCELIIIDADSPENESAVIDRYLKSHKNINYMRMNYRIGIYDAWNCGVRAARGQYLTNTNLDDLRRHDSFELQAATLDNLPFVDVVYQDFYYSFDPRMSFSEVAEFGYESNLPVITPHNMMEYNSPHNAPMWRKCLHEELGYFNVNYKSAGDYEFWMRCLVAGKTFYKINDPHVIYFQNPNGLSTRPDSRGVVEANEILKTYGKELVTTDSTMPFEDFCRKIVVPVSLDNGSCNRYFQTQFALRNMARHMKFPDTGE